MTIPQKLAERRTELQREVARLQHEASEFVALANTTAAELAGVNLAIDAYADAGGVDLMVFEHIEKFVGAAAETPAEIAVTLGLPVRAVTAAIEYWQRKGRLTLADGRVFVRQVWAIPGRPESRSGEAVGGGGGSDVSAIVAESSPDASAPSADDRRANLTADDVYRAERDGVLRPMAEGYVLIEPEIEPEPKRPQPSNPQPPKGRFHEPAGPN